MVMQVAKHAWKVSKTGLLIRDIKQITLRKSGKLSFTGISEHGNRIHFPENFLDHDATAVELSRLDVRPNAKIEKCLKKLAKTGKFAIHFKGVH